MSAKLYASRGSTNTYQTNIQAIIISISETSTESTITISIMLITITTGLIKTGLITIETIFKVSKFYVEVEITMEDQLITGQVKAQCLGGITDYNFLQSRLFPFLFLLSFFFLQCLFCLKCKTDCCMFSTHNFLVLIHFH